MPDFRNVIDKIHYDNHRDYTVVRGNVAYLDGAPLARPSSMPAAQRVIAIVIVIAAIVIGFMLVNTLIISRFQAAQAAEEAVQANLARQASIETIPQMQAMVSMDDDSIRANFASAGLKVFDLTGRDGSTDLSLYRIPDDVTEEEVAAYYLKGLSALEAEEASKLFEGGWSFSADRTSGANMVVRYVDFSTGDPQIAVQNAIIKEGFDTATIAESGEDDSGNTYSSGAFVVDGDVTCSWKVSALPLDEVYAISGLPEEACYVGVRVMRP